MQFAQTESNISDPDIVEVPEVEETESLEENEAERTENLPRENGQKRLPTRALNTGRMEKNENCWKTSPSQLQSIKC